jgi:hypothetical protein
MSATLAYQARPRFKSSQAQFKMFSDHPAWKPFFTKDLHTKQFLHITRSNILVQRVQRGEWRGRIIPGGSSIGRQGGRNGYSLPRSLRGGLQFL